MMMIPWSCKVYMNTIFESISIGQLEYCVAYVEINTKFEAHNNYLIF